MLVIRMVIPWENWGPSLKNEPGRISCMAEPIDLDGMPISFLLGLLKCILRDPHGAV